MTMLAKKWTPILTTVLLAGSMIFGFAGNCSAQNLTLYTPFTKISVPPGESIDYPIDLINKGTAARTGDLSVTGLPKGWTYTLKSGGWSVDEVSVLPGEKKSVTLQVQVPLQINKGTYHFQISARGLSQLPLAVVVSQQGTFKTEFTIDQPNMAGASNSTFTFNAKLRNYTAESEVYALTSLAPPGWTVAFKASYKQVSSVSVDANKTQDVTIDVNPPAQIAAGTYKVPVMAATGNSSADLSLEVGITGSYALQLTTPDGLLSTAITAGDDKRVEFVVKNTGSTDLKNINLQFAAPANWDVTFDPAKVDKLPPGGAASVFATIKPDGNAIVGDYMVNLTAKTPEANSTAAMRISVETSLIWSWSGILIILLALGCVYYLFRKYGRR